jgi:hypothetical protein
MTAKEFFSKIKEDFKARFDAPVPPPAAPPVPPAPAAPVAKTYKLLDGTEISITQAGEMPAVGDTVMIGGVPAPEGPYTLEDGATITVGPAGAITLYTAMAAPPPPAPPAPIVPAQPVTLSAEEVAAMYAKFATGTPEDRLANLEVMMKALMETNFGYEIRKGQEQTAIQAYKDSLATMQTTVDTATAQMQSAFAKTEEQAAVIAKHQQTITDLFELVEKLVEMPTGDPKTLTGGKKEKFENQNKKEDRIAKMAEAVKAMKAEAKK